jgi:hypothetical protein
MINGTLPTDTMITDYQSRQIDSAKTKINDSFIYIGNNAECVMVSVGKVPLIICS